MVGLMNTDNDHPTHVSPLRDLVGTVVFGVLMCAIGWGGGWWTCLDKLADEWAVETSEAWANAAAAKEWADSVVSKCGRCRTVNEYPWTSADSVTVTQVCEVDG
jgi:hypothetical protein